MMIITYCAQKMIRKSNYEFYNKKRGSGKSESKCKSMKLGYVAQFLSGPTFQVAELLSGPMFW